MSVKRLLYSLVLYLIFPIVLLRLYWRGRTNPAYRERVLERLGYVKLNGSKPVIWVHAVSVGETIAAKPLIEALLDQYPQYQLLVTSTTPTGSDQVKNLFNDRVEHVYFPYDLPNIIARFIKIIKPEILIIVETEIWPNLYSKCYQKQIPLLMVNARLSPRSTKSYQKIQSLVSETLAKVSLIAVRSELDKYNFISLGASKGKVEVTGNIKFDINLDDKQIEEGIQRRIAWGDERPVLVAASTHKGEDEALIKIAKMLMNDFPHLLLILVPRHPERFDDVFQLCLAQEGFKTLRHSRLDHYKEASDCNIIVGDTMGEMQSWFAAADVVFIGGSLVETGGHNPLEATVQGVPVVSGQYMFNFEDIAIELTKMDLLFICQNSDDLKNKIEDLLLTGRDSFSQNALKVMQQHRGITARLMDRISRYL